MDGMQFGQWFHSRRRSCGFSSQRALAQKAREDAHLAQVGISEAFLARLETGQLVHPFRGPVRQRVLALAQLLCHTSRELQTYLRMAELMELTSSEEALLARIRSQISTVKSGARLLFLPPSRMLSPGRQKLVAQFLEIFQHDRPQVSLITGLVGTGKSTLASAIVQQLARQDSVFPGGIISFPCRGYRGAAGLATLLAQVFQLVSSHFQINPGTSAEMRTSPFFVCRQECLLASPTIEASISSLISQLRPYLINRSFLFLLDDVDPLFPLARAIDALSGADRGPDMLQQQSSAFLVTSCYNFASASIAYTFSLAPLELEDAHAYLSELLPEPLDESEMLLVEKACAMVGYLPQAIEGLAASIRMGVPISLLLSDIAEQILSSEHHLSDRIDYAFRMLNPDTQKSFALLAQSGVSSFSLDTAVALQIVPSGKSQPGQLLQPFLADASSEHPLQRATQRTVSQLSQLVRHSFLEVLPAESLPSLVDLPVEKQADRKIHLISVPGKERQVRYRLHPMLQAYGSHSIQAVDQEEIHALRRNIRAYALTYIEQHTEKIASLLQEREILFTACMQALAQDQHDDVVRLVAGLAPISCRLQQKEDGDRLFYAGISASQQRHDRRQQAAFISSLGWLLCQRGAFQQARQTWEEGLAMTRASHLHQWQPLLGLAHLAHLQNQVDVASTYVEQYLNYSCTDANSLSTLAAQMRLASYRRLQGHREESGHLLTTILQSPALVKTDAHNDDAYVIDLMTRIEHDRLSAQYDASFQRTRQLTSFFQQQEEPYGLAYLLFNQMQFAQQQSIEDDLAVMAHWMLVASEQIQATYFSRYATQFLQQIPQLNRKRQSVLV
ncbi:ATP-binding protein [Tengunoibacter tsumagoiensis]|uniref:Orc1-like AAA ATPase domain-containing protein n=1 Tax=Tengunoibacter tsumagoiensis TaxID=2014871 RepID=A0A402A7Y8_9CHLR|nr:ATP-binding protein [Tengunoibacter tsumagoiensis]GCE15290.1 hypothetical protein KTT_51490 [Tengunoibacter tsumagoiensis]